MPDGTSNVMCGTDTLTGKMGNPLPEYNWTEVLATSVEERVSNNWMQTVKAVNDPIWNEYLRHNGPVVWTEQEKPESELLRYALRADEAILERLKALVDHLPSPRAKKAIAQAVDFCFKVKFRES